jgi:adenylate cyclase
MRTWLARLWRFNSQTLGVLLTALVVLLYGVVEVTEWQLPLIRAFERLDYDGRFRFRDHFAAPRLPGPEVVIAAIDEKSIDALGRWPWPYTVQAQLVDRLVQFGAAVIGYDVVFSSPDDTLARELVNLQEKLQANGHGDALEIIGKAIAAADHNGRFAQALRDSQRTVLGYFFYWDKREVGHLDPAEEKRFQHSIRESAYDDLDLGQSGVSLLALPLQRAWAVEANTPLLSQTAWGSGFFNSVPDPEDGAIRRYPLVVRYRDEVNTRKDSRQDKDQVFPPLAIRVLERYLGKALTNIYRASGRVDKVVMISSDEKRRFSMPTDQRGWMLINYLGPSEIGPSQRASVERHFRFPRYSIVDILNGEVPPTVFQDKIVLVGATAIALADLFPTPVDPRLPGIETHATIIDNILQGNFLFEPLWAFWYIVGSIIMLGALLTLFLPRFGPLWGDLFAAVLFFGSWVVHYRLFTDSGLALSTVYPMVTVVVVWAGMTIYHYVVENKDKRFLRKIFGTYLSPELIEQMVQTKIPPQLGGSSDIRTAYFTDIASFSTFSEALSATKLVELLNEYLTAMTDILLDEGGTLDKYEGDAIVAFFGAPLPQEDHAARALRVALRMQEELARLRAKWSAEVDKKWPEIVQQMRMRIGISSGEIVTGNMGSKTRMNYTMMGDVVNTAARLEASAKQYGIYIQCTSEALEWARKAGAEFECRIIDKVRVVGRTEPVDTVEIMAWKDQLSEDLSMMRDLYHQGLDLYRQQKWDEAMAKFVESDRLEEVFPKRPTTPSRVYIERCEFFKEHPPEKDWDGVWTLTSK